MSVRRIVPILMLAAAVGAPGLAGARGPDVDRPAASTTHQVVTAGFQYAPPRITIAAGDGLEHTNLDAELHDLVSDRTRPDGSPYFRSELIGTGENASVPTEDVPPGIYSFTCSIHPFMLGTLEVRDLAPQPPPGWGDVEIAAGDNFFAPKTVTVPAGTTVRWRNDGNIAHSVTASDGSWDSSPTCPSAKCWAPDETFSRTFNDPGTFAYYCKLHGTPLGSGHAGTIQVVPPGSVPSEVTSATATPNGTTISVSGSATFGGEAPITVAADPTGDGPAAAGLDIVEARVYRADPGIDKVTFEWRLAELPGTGILPGTRYIFPMTHNGGDVAALARIGGSDAAEGDPGGSAVRVMEFDFRVGCQGDTAEGCLAPEVGSIEGSYDVRAGVVRITVPVSPAEGFLDPGDLIGASTSTSIRAGTDAAIGDATAADVAAWTPGLSYRIADRSVLLGIARAGTAESEVAFETPAELSGDTFSGSLSAPGPGTWDVWIRACFGTNCGTSIRRVEL